MTWLVFGEELLAACDGVDELSYMDIQHYQ